jgi:hypothetical protein
MARVTRRQFAFGQSIPAQPPKPAGFPKAVTPPQVGGAAPAKRAQEEGASTAQPQAEALAKAETVVETPIKVEGVLRDPQNGAPLPNREFEVYSESGLRIYTDASDEQGRFSFTFSPESPGTFTFKVKPEGYAAPVQTLEVSVKPKL